MFTQKKLFLFLITSGVIAFLIGLLMVAGSKSQFISSAQPHQSAAWTTQGMLLVGMIATGTGCYLLGSFNSKNNRHRYTIDFSKSK